jgi:hypothetical protein
MTRAPMNRDMSCDQLADTVAHYLERSVDAQTAARVEQHAVSCEDCGALLALRIEAASLPELVPSRDLWPEIAARIETPVVELPGTAVRTAGHAQHRMRNRAWLGLAAAALIVVTATITREVTKASIQASNVAAPAPVRVAQVPPRDSAPAIVAPAPAAAPVVATKLPVAKVAAPPAKTTSRLVANRTAPTSPSVTAEQTYDREISRLRAVVSRRRGQLDSGTVATIEKNLIVIDDAIKQCKLALRKDPASRFLMESLNDAMDTKVQLLRTAATLPTKS